MHDHASSWFLKFLKRMHLVLGRAVLALLGCADLAKPQAAERALRPILFIERDLVAAHPADREFVLVDHPAIIAQQCLRSAMIAWRRAAHRPAVAAGRAGYAAPRVRCAKVVSLAVHPDRHALHCAPSEINLRRELWAFAGHSGVILKRYDRLPLVVGSP